MSIDVLFEELQDKYEMYYLNGEFTLLNDKIVWTYMIDDMCEEDEYQNFDVYNDEVNLFNVLTTEEILQEKYEYDSIKINQIIENFDGLNKWGITEPEISNNVIAFEIYRE